MGDTRHAGYPVPSETFNPRDQGTDWPADQFTGMVATHPSSSIQAPARHSYDGDGNMEAYEIAGPYSAANETNTDLGHVAGVARAVGLGLGARADRRADQAGANRPGD